MPTSECLDVRLVVPSTDVVCGWASGVAQSLMDSLEFLARWRGETSLGCAQEVVFRDGPEDSEESPVRIGRYELRKGREDQVVLTIVCFFCREDYDYTRGASTPEAMRRWKSGTAPMIWRTELAQVIAAQYLDSGTNPVFDRAEMVVSPATLLAVADTGQWASTTPRPPLHTLSRSPLLDRWKSNTG